MVLKIMKIVNADGYTDIRRVINYKIFITRILSFSFILTVGILCTRKLPNIIL